MLVIGIRGDSSVNDLLTLSQVVLALQLPFAMFPLLHFTSSRAKMGAWKSGMFSDDCRLVERDFDHRAGYLGITGFDQVRVACDCWWLRWTEI